MPLNKKSKYMTSQEALTAMLFEYRLKSLLIATGCIIVVIAVFAYFAQFYFLDNHPIPLGDVLIVAGLGCSPAVKYYFSSHRPKARR